MNKTNEMQTFTVFQLSVTCLNKVNVMNVLELIKAS